MKKVVFAFLPWFFSFFGYKVVAQEDGIQKKDESVTQEIIIRKKGDKDTKVTIQINGDKVLINGKPMVEYNEDGITVNKRKIIVRDGDEMQFAEGMDFPGEGSFSWNSSGKPEKRAFLGVNTAIDYKGAIITNVNGGTAAEKAGLQVDDIITKVNDEKISSPESLSAAIRSNKPGEEVKIRYLRKGKEKSVKVKLGEKESEVMSFSFSTPEGGQKTFTIPPVPPVPPVPDMDQMRELQELQNLSEMNRWDIQRGNTGEYEISTFPRRQKLGLKIQDTEDGSGVKIIEVADSSAAANAGLKKDDIITTIAGISINNTDDAREQLMENAEKNKYTIKAKRNGIEQQFEIKIPKKLKTANL
ncbi:MAG: PDZ domain-containing protein [Sphingobacteriales bacterium]|nr:PDZ domain-containing protein [Sphingobacteriales bacterium]